MMSECGDSQRRQRPHHEGNKNDEQHVLRPPRHTGWQPCQKQSAAGAKNTARISVSNSSSGRTRWPEHAAMIAVPWTEGAPQSNTSGSSCSAACWRSPSKPTTSGPQESGEGSDKAGRGWCAQHDWSQGLGGRWCADQKLGATAGGCAREG